MRKLTAFEIQCNAITKAVGLNETIFFFDEQHQAPFEDDGTLHVMKGTTRACFDVGAGQSLSGKKQNENTREVLALLGLKVSDDCLVDEEEDEEHEFCRYCGR